MKKIIYVLLGAVLLFSSCTEEVVKVKPTTAIEADGMIVDGLTARTAVNGVYSGIQLLYNSAGYYIMSTGVYSDNLDHTGTFPDLAELFGNDAISSNIWVTRIWRDHYDPIFRANKVIQDVTNLPEDKISDEDRSAIIAEVRFLRALNYFKLVRLFGPVPKIDSPIDASLSNLNVARSSVAEIYSFIKQDIDAATSLPVAGSNDDAFKASKGAVYALKAKVHLELGEFEDAKLAAQEVISHGYALVGEYANLWNQAANTESVFQIDYNQADQNSLGFWFDNIAGRYEVGPSADLIAAFEDGDERRDMIIDQDGFNAIIKYNDVSNGSDKPYVFRLADVYLDLAEALFRGDADYDTGETYINLVRNRAGLGDVDVTAANWQEILLQERRVELYAEGSRWFDLKRLGVAEDVISAKPVVDFPAVQGKYLLWPIPQDEIDANGAISTSDQNPGY